MNSAVLRRSVCHSCQCIVLRSFAVIAGVSLPAKLSRPSVKYTGSQQRPYIGLNKRFSEQNPPTSSVFPDKPRSPHLENVSSSSTSDPSTPIPWYLQVSTPPSPAPAHPVAPFQEIPQLPPNPPPLLSPLINHLSTTLGLNSLTLLDLRQIDTPLALGANLLMILSTARSVKHLNMSADRLCRWLRSEYKLHPYADGLLGRHELKLKLRRRARKMRLAQSVGNTLAVRREMDDGITTSWICVNVGLVPGAVLEDCQEIGLEAVAKDVKINDQDRDNGYVGFGSRTSDPRIVVQIFTEEKRAEMDLERLWNIRNARRGEKKQDSCQGAEQNQTEDQERMSHEEPEPD